MKNIFFIALFFSVTAFGLPSINTLKVSISSQELEEAKVKFALKKINDDLEKAVRNKSKIESQVGSIDLEINELNQQLKENSNEYQGLKQKLAIKSLNLKQGAEIQMLQNLLAARSTAKAEQRAFVLKKLLRNDLSLLSELKETLERIEFQKNNLEAKQLHLVAAQKKLQAAFELLNIENANKMKLISEARKSLKYSKNRLNALREKNSELSFMFEELFFEKKGKLSTPSAGAIDNIFGPRQLGETNLKVFNRGIFFESADKKPVFSVSAGSIALVERIDEWGLTVVVDHGDHYYSTYSNLLDSKVNLGERVLANSSIGEAKNLYFEVRHFTEPQNPLEWLKGNKSEKN